MTRPQLTWKLTKPSGGHKCKLLPIPQLRTAIFTASYPDIYHEFHIVLPAGDQWPASQAAPHAAPGYEATFLDPCELLS